MSRAWSLALPVLTILVVCYALLIAGAPRKLVGARIYGGPSEGVSTLALRIETVQRVGERELPEENSALLVQARAAGSPPLTRAVSVTSHGISELELPFAHPIHGPVKLDVRLDSGALVASGAWSLDGAQWAARARRRGGWIRGRADGELVVSVAPARGAFVVGVADSLLVRVERGGDPVPGAQLSFSADGALLSGAQELQTDARGRAQLSFEASELNPSLRVEARTSAGQRGLIDSAIPVVPGGFHGLRTSSGMRVEVAVPRAEAFFSVVSDSGRVTGGVLALAPNGRGGAVGTAELPALAQPAWLVVSSEVDEHSAAAIGWPLEASAEPAQTFDVPEALLLDGLPGVFEREQARRSRVRWLTAAFIACAFALSVVLLVLRVRAADRDISRHLREALEAEAVARVAPRRFLSLLVALLTIGLGFIALGLVVLARSR